MATIKHHLLLLISLVLSVYCYAQSDFVLKQGTLVHLVAEKTIRASKQKVGDMIPFSVRQAVMVNDHCIIPKGTLVLGRVVMARRSAWWGTKGRLIISIREVILPDGTSVPLDYGDFEIQGENRTALSLVTFFAGFWPGFLICGGGAVMPQGFRITTEVAEDIYLTATNDKPQKTEETDTTTQSEPQSH